MLSGIIYAPTGDVTLSGGGSGGDVYGAVVGRTVVLNGGARFHYDEALADFNSNGIFAVQRWEEMVRADDRADAEEHFNF